MKPEIFEPEPRPYERRTYWFQCPGDLYDQDFMMYLEQQENADRLQNIAIKMFCFCVARAPLQKDVGRLRMRSGGIYTEGILAKMLRVDLDYMRVAMRAFQDLGLVRFEDDGALCIPWIQDHVGSLAASSVRSEKSRKRKESGGSQKKIVAMQQTGVATQPRYIDRSVPPKGETDLPTEEEFCDELRKTEEFLSLLVIKKEEGLGRSENP